VSGWPAVILRVAGSGLLIATAAIHLDLYLTSGSSGASWVCVIRRFAPLGRSQASRLARTERSVLNTPI
jgi:hypothetical protein